MFRSSFFIGAFYRAMATSLLALTIAVPASAASWRSYHNTRFGSTGDVPANWKMQRAPQNNDGRSFLSPDGKGNIIISGIFSTFPHEEEIADRLKPDDGETLTKSSSDADHVRVEGTKDANAFVRVSVLSCSGRIWNDLVITYPTAEAAKYRATIDHAVASFRPGPGYDMTCK